MLVLIELDLVSLAADLITTCQSLVAPIGCPSLVFQISIQQCFSSLSLPLFLSSMLFSFVQLRKKFRDTT